MLQATELTLDGSTLVVQGLEPSRGARDERVETSALTHTLAGVHSLVGQRHFDAPRFPSAPANVHVPCSHSGGAAFPALTAGVIRSGMIGLIPRWGHASCIGA